MSENNDTSSKDIWDIIKILSISLGTLAVPLVIAFVGHNVNIAIKDREVRLRTVELAIDIIV